MAKERAMGCDLVKGALGAAALMLVATSASAGVITAPVSVLSAPPVIGAFSFDRTIDQSGLTAGYVSGVTDFSTYVGAGPRHLGSNTPENYAASSSLPPNAVVDYDMGSSMGVLQLAFWQYPFFNSGPVLEFAVYTSDDSLFGVSSFVGTFPPVKDGSGLGAPGTGVQVFDLLDTTARYVRIDVRTTDNSAGFGWSEVAFDVAATAVPEPGTLALLGLGLAGLAASRRRKQ